MKKLIPDNQLPGFVGLIYREEGDEVVARYSDRTERDHATVFFRRELEPGETIRAVIPLTTIIQLGAETAVAFRPHSQFELEDLMYLLDNNEMADLANLGDTLKERGRSGEGVGEAETGGFTLTGIGDLGAGVCWHDDESRDSIMIASLFEEASAAGLIETPTANGAEIGLRIGVDRGFGVYEGQDTCWVRMYCETWEHLAADVMPASPDNFGIAIARAGCERGPDLARELLLMALEYANVIYRNLAPYLNDEEREAAGLSAVPQ